MRATTRQLARALKHASDLLEVERADYCFEGRFRFPLDAEWSIVLSCDDAERLRVEVCLLSRVVSTLWTHAEDRSRLGELILTARRESAELISTR